MGDLTRNRVRERIETLGLNPIEAARIAGFERTYFHDLLNGKKHTIREKNLPAAAQALQCDADYLTGVQDEPRRAGAAHGKRPTGIAMTGIVEAGAWREKDGPIVSMGPVPVDPDFRYATAEQQAYRVRGDQAAGVGIDDGMILIAVTEEGLALAGRKLRTGDAVIVQRSNGSLVETTVRVFEDTPEGVRLSAKPRQGEIATLEMGDGVEIVGLIVRAIRVFDLPA
jgi:hypothetical protein